MRSIPRNCVHFHNRLYNPNDYVGLPYILLPPLNFSSRHQELESAPNASAFYKRWKLYKNQYTCLPVSELQVGRKDKSCVLCHMDFYWQLSRKYVPRGEEYSAEECIFLWDILRKTQPALYFHSACLLVRYSYFVYISSKLYVIINVVSTKICDTHWNIWYTINIW